MCYLYNSDFYGDKKNDKMCQIDMLCSICIPKRNRKSHITWLIYRPRKGYMDQGLGTQQFTDMAKSYFVCYESLTQNKCAYQESQRKKSEVLCILVLG